VAAQNGLYEDHDGEIFGATDVDGGDDDAAAAGLPASVD
jgi:hypothetical protein